MQLYFLTLTCSIYNNISDLLTKGYHGCKCCGTSTKVRWSKHLQKLVYNFSRVFIQEDHPYRRVASTFNGKPKRTQRTKINSLVDWIRAYDTEKENEFSEFFDLKRKPLFDDPKFLDTYVERMPIGMKRKYTFYDLPYLEHPKTVPLLDPAHILKNVSSSLWRNISLKKSDTLVVRRDPIYSNAKKRHRTRKESRGKDGPPWSFKECDVPWILNKHDLLWQQMLYWM